MDIVIVGQHFGEKVTMPLDPNPDVNDDKVVDILDLVLVGQHFGESYLPAAPSMNLWVIEPQYLPVLIKMYGIMESNPSSDPNFLFTKNILHRLVFNAKAVNTELFQNYPNPFNPETWIPYQLSIDSDMLIRIYSASGNLIRTLNLGYQTAGFYTSKDRAAYWDGKNEAGEEVSSGIYFYSIQTGDFTATKKMVITR